MKTDKAYRYWMHNLPGVGDRTIEKLLKEFGCAEQVYLERNRLPQQMFRQRGAEKIKEFSKAWEVEKEYETMLQKGIRFCSLEDADYPGRLRKLTHPPYALYCMGNMPEENCSSIAIIGARECSEYGRYMAQAFAGKMAEAKVAVVSGMARGIDGISQRAAVEKKGRTYAVLGNGVDVCYPASNKGLYQDIQDTGGGILSTFPPGTPPQKAQFPERNRIVAGLADIILVVEARAKSGTWITVDMALEQGKNIYAVPGRLTDRLSDGCNLLIRQGAGIALAPEDILAELKVLTNRQGIKNKKEEKSRTGAGSAGAADFLDFYPKSAEMLLLEMRKADMAVELPDLLTELIGLCVEGRAKQIAGSHFVKVHGR